MTRLNRCNRSRRPVFSLVAALVLTASHVVARRAQESSGGAAASYDKAIAELTEAIRFDPKNAANYWKRAEARWRKANALNLRDEYRLGIADCDQALALNSREAWAYQIRGKCQPTDFTAAIQDFSTAIHLDPRLTAAYVARAAAWLESARLSRAFGAGKADDKQYDRAIADLNEALRLEPQDAAAWWIRGNVWREKREHGKAIADYGEAVRLEPAVVDYRLSFADALRENGDNDRAIAAYSEALRLAPDNLEAVEHRGDAWMRKGKYERAAADYGKAGAFTKRREALRASGQYEKLLDDLGDAIRQHPKGFVAYEQLARLFAACPEAKYRNGQRAVEYAKTACELTGWQNRMTLATLAAAYAESGDFQKAMQWQATAIRLGGPEDQIHEFNSRLKLYQRGKPYHDQN